MSSMNDFCLSIAYNTSADRNVIQGQDNAQYVAERLLDYSKSNLDLAIEQVKTKFQDANYITDASQLPFDFIELGVYAESYILKISGVNSEGSSQLLEEAIDKLNVVLRLTIEQQTDIGLESAIKLIQKIVNIPIIGSDPVLCEKLIIPFLDSYDESTLDSKNNSNRIAKLRNGLTMPMFISSTTDARKTYVDHPFNPNNNATYISELAQISPNPYITLFLLRTNNFNVQLGEEIMDKATEAIISASTLDDVKSIIRKVWIVRNYLNSNSIFCIKSDAMYEVARKVVQISHGSEEPLFSEARDLLVQRNLPTIIGKGTTVDDVNQRLSVFTTNVTRLINSYRKLEINFLDFGDRFNKRDEGSVDLSFSKSFSDFRTAASDLGIPTSLVRRQEGKMFVEVLKGLDEIGIQQPVVRGQMITWLGEYADYILESGKVPTDKIMYLLDAIHPNVQVQDYIVIPSADGDTTQAQLRSFAPATDLDSAVQLRYQIELRKYLAKVEEITKKSGSGNFPLQHDYFSTPLYKELMANPKAFFLLTEVIGYPDPISFLEAGHSNNINYLENYTTSDSYNAYPLVHKILEDFYRPVFEL